MIGFTSRRGLLKSLVLLFASRASRAAALLEIDRVAGSGPHGAPASHLRRYRVHATITLLSVPLFSKENVGGACVLSEQSAAGPSAVSTIQFVSGSWPERLKGFNRFGMVQEAVREESGAAVESAYLSFMTSSAEKNLDQAKKSFAERSAAQPISIAHGRARVSGYAAALDHLSVPAKCTWADCPRLMVEMRDRLSPLTEAVSSTNRTYLPFLHTVRAAFASNAPSESTFVHNAKLYRLRTKISPTPGGLLLIGKIAEQGTTQESEFKVWYDPSDGTGLPLRFEFKPKSFLHLVYEQDPAVNGPKFSPLIAQEQA
jgi:hypothetical protein